MLQTEVALDVLFTGVNGADFNLSADLCVKGFKVSQLPFIDQSKIREFNMEEIAGKDCLKAILEDLD